MNNQSIFELDKAIRLNPEDATNYINRGYAYYKKVPLIGQSKITTVLFDSVLTTRLTLLILTLNTEGGIS